MPCDEGEFAGRLLCAAVADGASESLLAGVWAADLVTRFTSPGASTELATVLREAADGWNARLAEYIAGREAVGRPIQWYEEPGLAKGAYATIVGLHLADSVCTYSEEGPFRAWALGDACLFQIRDDAVRTSFPISDADAFGNTPDLAPSCPVDFSLVQQHVVAVQGRWRSGDAFYLATDAMAQWFLATAALGEQPWKLLGDLGTADGPTDFNTWVEERRLVGALRNDDTTLLRIDIH
jgi:hypothetical protein